jgi:hypothetical protein
MRARSALAVFACAAMASLAVALPASAGLTTYCEGEAGAVTVPGDLRVAATKSCVLDGTTVTGTVTVEAGANLVINGGTFEREVFIQDDGFFDAKGTVLKGALTVTDGYGLYLDGARMGAVRVTVDKHPERATYAYLREATVGGDVNSQVGEVYAENSTLSGNVTGTNLSYVDLVGSVVEKNLTVTGARRGSVFCAGEVYGDASYSGNSGDLQIGADGPVTGCTSASYWGGNLTVNGNTANVKVSNNIIRGNLVGASNDPAPVGSGNRVRGTVSGQFVNLAPAAAAKASAMAGQDRAGAKVGDRRAQARAQAKSAGPAAL